MINQITENKTLQEKVNDLIDDQLVNWTLARDNYAGLK
ncbi:MAG: hypothetical protein JG782_559 [Anaerophaga sp.]|nr:hypothetical protein [Anaerophaga sp.]